jgi:hypothetical protein
MYVMNVYCIFVSWQYGREIVVPEADWKGERALALKVLYFTKLQ